MRRILSIDGGGIRGIIPAELLADLERSTGAARVLPHRALVGGVRRR
jgi:patatin-like phospholipase/acyl hydrolase